MKRKTETAIAALAAAFLATGVSAQSLNADVNGAAKVGDSAGVSTGADVGTSMTDATKKTMTDPVGSSSADASGSMGTQSGTATDGASTDMGGSMTAETDTDEGLSTDTDGSMTAQTDTGSDTMGTDDGPAATMGTGQTADSTTMGTGSGDMSMSEDKSEIAANGNAMGQQDGPARTYGELVSSLKTSDTLAADLSGYDAESDISVTQLSSLQGEGAENGQALDDFLAENEADVDTMKSNIEANADIMAKLETEGYTADDVIAVQTMGDTGVAIYVDDTEKM